MGKAAVVKGLLVAEAARRRGRRQADPLKEISQAGGRQGPEMAARDHLGVGRDLKWPVGLGTGRRGHRV